MLPPPVESTAVHRRRLLVAGVGGLGCALARTGWTTGQADGPQVRMAFIDPLTGPAADIGRNSLNSWQFMAGQLQSPGGARFRVAGFDNKGSPQESLNVLKVAIDQGFRYILQGNGSGVTAALSEAITRHNQMRPDRAVLLINYAAMDPALTAELCSPWHFRIEADTSMKMRALVGFLASQADLDRVYLLNQNYAHGQQFAAFFKAELARQAPRVQVVGEELHPPFQLQDFAVHVQRIRASGARAVVTGNWGADLRRLVQALQSQGPAITMLGYYPHLAGTPKVLAASGDRLPVYAVATTHTNQAGPIAPLAAAFRQRFGEDLVVHASYDGIRMLDLAVARAGSAEPARVAAQLAGMRFEGAAGTVHMRAEDHQLQTSLRVVRWERVSPQHPISAEETGYTFAPVRTFEASQLSSPPRCDMRRAALPSAAGEAAAAGGQSPLR